MCIVFWRFKIMQFRKNLSLLVFMFFQIDLKPINGNVFNVSCDDSFTPLLEVYYSSCEPSPLSCDYEFHMENYKCTEDEPRIILPHHDPLVSQYYLLMVDMDVPTFSSEPAYYLHWIFESIPNSGSSGQSTSVEGGTDALGFEYSAPNPPEDSGVHHYQFILFEQLFHGSLSSFLNSRVLYASQLSNLIAVLDPVFIVGSIKGQFQFRVNSESYHRSGEDINSANASESSTNLTQTALYTSPPNTSTTRRTIQPTASTSQPTSRTIQPTTSTMRTTTSTPRTTTSTPQPTTSTSQPTTRTIQPTTRTVQPTTRTMQTTTSTPQPTTSTMQTTTSTPQPTTSTMQTTTSTPQPTTSTMRTTTRRPSVIATPRTTRTSRATTRVPQATTRINRATTSTLKVVDCMMPDSEDTAYMPSQILYYLNDELTAMCISEDSILVGGSQPMVCQSSGNWSHVSRCVHPGTCNPPCIPAHGICAHENSSSKCVCEPGFEICVDTNFASTDLDVTDFNPIPALIFVLFASGVILVIICGGAYYIINNPPSRNSIKGYDIVSGAKSLGSTQSEESDVSALTVESDTSDGSPESIQSPASLAHGHSGVSIDDVASGASYASGASSNYSGTSNGRVQSDFDVASGASNYSGTSHPSLQSDFYVPSNASNLSYDDSDVANSIVSHQSLLLY